MPALCSWLLALISATRSLTRLIELTTSPTVWPARSATVPPASMRVTLSAIKAFTSFAAAALRCASERTSLATTAKPRPWSPARAASTAALSARMLVWKAMPSITPTMSAMRLELSLRPCIVVTSSPTAWPPRCATSLAAVANWLACRALSALWRTAPVSCSIEAAVCCSALACSSVRWLRSRLPCAISLEAVATLSALRRTSDTAWRSACCISASDAIMLELSPARSRTGCVRSPAATRRASAAASAGSAPSSRSRPRVTARPVATSAARPSRKVAMPALRKRSKRCAEAVSSRAATSLCSFSSASRGVRTSAYRARICAVARRLRSGSLARKASSAGSSPSAR